MDMIAVGHSRREVHPGPVSLVRETARQRYGVGNAGATGKRVQPLPSNGAGDVDHGLVARRRLGKHNLKAVAGARGADDEKCQTGPEDRQQKGQRGGAEKVRSIHGRPARKVPATIAESLG